MDRLNFFKSIELDDFVESVTYYFDEIMTLYDIIPKSTSCSMSKQDFTPVFNICLNTLEEADILKKNLDLKPSYENYGRVFNINSVINGSTVIVTIE